MPLAPLAIFALVAFRQAPTTPVVLIAQIPAKSPKVDAPFADAMAQVLQDSKKLTPVVWSLTDPTFREASQKGAFGVISDTPTQDELPRVAKALGAEYVIICTAWLAKPDSVKAEATLSVGSKVIWKGSTEMGAKVNGKFSEIDSASSIGRTWMFQMYEGVLKDLKVDATLKPKDDVGTMPAVPKPAPQAIPSDASEVLAAVDKALHDGKPAAAVTMLRDALSRMPLSVDLRVALIELLMDQGQFDTAANEANSAASLFPAETRFHALAAQAWLRAGNEEAAQREIKYVTSHNPSDPNAQQLMAELALRNRKPDEALAHLDALKAADITPHVKLLRLVADEMAGAADKVAADLRALGGSPDVDELAPLLNSEWKFLFETSRRLIQESFVRPKDQALVNSLDNATRRVAGLSLIFGAEQPTQSQQKTVDRCQLALNLLSQSLEGIRAYLKSPNEDVRSDASIDLAEAVKQYEAASQT